jgi:glutamate carboxypeptidase
LERRLRYFEQRRELMVQAIRELVEIESPSDNKAAVDRIGQFLTAKFEALGGQTQFHRTSEFGDSLQIDFPADSTRKPVLLLGHFDTVYPLGTLAKMPCEIENGRLHGPGVLDMKSGIALMLHAIEALQAWHGAAPRPITVFLVSDEEVGSYSSRKITEELGEEIGGCFGARTCCRPSWRGEDCAQRRGRIYSARKRRIAAHAGLDPGKGHSAILELARQLTVIAKLNDLRRESPSIPA